MVCRILKMVVSDTPVNADSGFFFNRVSSSTSFSTLSTLSNVVAPIDLPERESSSIGLV